MQRQVDYPETEAIESAAADKDIAVMSLVSIRHAFETR